MPLLNVEVTTIVQSGVYFQNVFPYMCYPLPYTYNKTTDLRNWERGVFLIEWQGIKLKCKFVSDTHKALDLLSRGSSLLYFFSLPSLLVYCVYIEFIVLSLRCRTHNDRFFETIEKENFTSNGTITILSSSCFPCK